MAICLITLFFLITFSPKPPLLQGRQFSLAIYDENHQLLRLTLSNDDKYRLFTPLKEIPDNLIQATLLQEDQYFYQHPGINPVSLIKATLQTYILQSRRMGASTITMQLARMHFGLKSKKISGKINQIYRALQLERHYSKQEILEAYLNLAPYGGNVEGVGAASLIWFMKPLSQITLPEALTLAVIPQNPEARKPPGSQLKTIRNKLYQRWIQQHPLDISFEAAIALPLGHGDLKRLPFRAPHFTTAIKEKWQNKAHSLDTTLDISLQTIMERMIKQYIQRTARLGVNNAAAILVDSRNMEVKALVGSADFFNKNIAGQINGSTIQRSPGSALKPFIYALALDQGLIHPRTMLKDVPHSFGSYNPENFDKDFAGPISAEDALVLSRNVPAVYLASQLTTPNLYSLLENAQVAHLKSEAFYGLSLALGGAELSMQELTTLYAMLANQGELKPLRTLKQEKYAPGKKLLSPEASELTLDMLSKTSANLYEKTNFPISFKTGTSSGHRDAWTSGIFGPYVLTVWAGNFDNSSNAALIGKDIAAPLFLALIQAIKQEKGSLPTRTVNRELLNIVEVDICKASGLLPTPFCTFLDKTWFIPGKSPIKKDTIFREIAINQQTGLRTCRIDNNTLYAIYEFWPTDLLAIFRKAGISPKTPPQFETGCDTLSTQGMAPHISSLQKELRYIFRANNSDTNTIPFTAITDADVVFVHWFVNDRLVAKTTPDKPFLWQAQPGNFTVRVVDDHGQSDVRTIQVQVEQ